MLFHLFIFFSHMNWSIHSYSGGKLTIRMIHVHIVICLTTHRQPCKMQQETLSHAVNVGRYHPHFSSSCTPSPISHFSQQKQLSSTDTVSPRFSHANGNNTVTPPSVQTVTICSVVGTLYMDFKDGTIFIHHQTPYYRSSQPVSVPSEQRQLCQSTVRVH